VAAVRPGGVGHLLPQPEDLALGIVDEHSLVRVGPTSEAVHLGAQRELADLIPADSHELVVGPDVPSVGGVLGVHVGHRHPVELLLAAPVDVQPPLHHLFELVARE
jgi:hypothetical protein